MDHLETMMKRSPVGTGSGDAFKDAQALEMERKGPYQGELGIDGYRAYKSALSGYIRKNNSGASVDEIKALSAGSDPDDGYWVTPDMTGRIAQLIHETSARRQVANIVTIGSDRLEGIADTGDAEAGWVGETDARSETTSPTIDQWPNEKLQILSLPKPPLLDVVSIHYYDEKEVRQLYPAEYYYSDAVSTPGRLVLKSNVTPPITYRKAAAIEITYHAGYGHVATDVPAPLRQAILRLTAYLYEHRDMHDRMQDAMQMSGVMMLLSPYKMVGLS